MEKEKAEAVIEAVLFTMGESVGVSRLAEVIGEKVSVTKEILSDMMRKLEK